MGAEQYHEMAIVARAAAASEALPRRRSQHEQSAERWEEMARLAEDTADRKIINEAARRANPYGQS